MHHAAQEGFQRNLSFSLSLFFFFDFADSRKKLEIEDLRIECCFTVFSLTSKNTCQKLKKVLLTTSLGFPGGSDNKASACNVGDRGSMFPGVSFLLFSSFGFKPPASVFQSYSYSSFKTSPPQMTKHIV